MHTKYHLATCLGAWGLISISKGRLDANILPALLVGGSLIDLIDHGFYYIFTLRPLTLKEIIKKDKLQYEKQEPHFYFFHTFEVFFLLFLLSNKFWWGKYFLVMYAIHLVLDALRYLMKKKGDYYWFKKWWLVYNLCEGLEKNARVA